MGSNPNQSDRIRPPAPTPESYWGQTQRPLHCLVFILPMLAAFEIGVAIAGTDLFARNLLQGFLTQFGASAAHLPAALLVVVLITWHILSHHRWRIELHVLIGMAAEAMALAIPLVVIGALLNQLVAATAGVGPGTGETLWEMAMVRIGGGVYEEFLFRMIGLNLVGLIFIDVAGVPKDIGRAAAVVITALAFALYHFPNADTQPILWWRFAFFFIAGCYQGAVYLLRGFGIAAGAHVFYNMIELWLEFDAPV